MLRRLIIEQWLFNLSDTASFRRQKTHPVEMPLRDQHLIQAHTSRLPPFDIILRWTDLGSASNGLQTWHADAAVNHTCAVMRLKR